MFQKGTFLLDENRTACAEIQLTAEHLWVDLRLRPGQEHVLRGTVVDSRTLWKRGARITLKFLSADGESIGEGRPKRDQRKPSLPDTGIREYDVRFFVPDTAYRVRIGFSAERNGSRSVLNSFQVLPTETLDSEYYAVSTPPDLLIEGDYLLKAEKSADATLDMASLHNTKKYFDIIDRLDFTVVLRLDGDSRAISSKSGLLLVTFLDENGALMKSRAPIHAGRRGQYVYLSFSEPAFRFINLFAPIGCVRVALEFVAWEAPADSLRIANLLTIHTPAISVAVPRSAVEVSGITKAYLDEQIAEHSYVPLSTETIWVEADIDAVRAEYEVHLQLDGDKAALVEKAGILRVEFFDKYDNPLKSRRPMKLSEKFGHYVYLDARHTGLYSYTISPPRTCAKLRIGFRAWHSEATPIRVRNEFLIKSVEPPRKIKPAQHKSLSPKLPPRRASEIRVALVCDEFTFNSFKYEFSPVVLQPHNWREAFELEKPDIFLCESAWSGVDSLVRPWKGRVYASTNFVRENRTEIFEIVSYCRKNNIPTVFWNKEDPSHFDDRIHDFVETAKLFDHVFTTDADCIERYREEHGIDGVQCLPFATQPRIYNPSNPCDRDDKVVFAGSWYDNHEVRSAEMEAILDSILNQGMALEIYDRYFDTDDKLHMFPDKYRPHLKPPIPHRGLADIYRTAKYGLNINTVTESSTMFARRIFELISSNTLVMSNYSVGIDNIFGDGVEFVGTSHAGGRLSSLKPEDQEAIRYANLHKVLAEHTYEDRFKTILDTCGIEYDRAEAEITLVGRVNDHAGVARLVRLWEINYATTNRLLVLLGDDIPRAEISMYYMKYNRNGVTVAAESLIRSDAKLSLKLIESGHFFLVDVANPPSKEELANGSLHRKYVDCPILIDSPKTYTFSDSAVIRNVLAPRESFRDVIEGCGSKILGRFYHV